MSESPYFRVVSFSEWWNGDKQQRRLDLVDVRVSDEYLRRRIDDPETVIVHLPLDSLKTGERSGELPPRHVEFAVLIPAEDKLVPVLEEVKEFFGATKSRATQQSRQPWRVRQILVATPEFWKEASEHSVLLEGPLPSKNSNNEFTPLPRLWQPDPLVQCVLLPLLTEMMTCQMTASDEIWDLGSGAGRDVCFLAEQLRSQHPSKNFKIVGIDCHKASAQRCIPFWTRRGVEECTEARLLNLNKPDVVKEELRKSSVVCFYAIRFLNRNLIGLLAGEASLRPGTLFAMSHFCKPKVGISWDFDHPKEKHVLERDELRTLFQQQGGKWEILHNEIGSDGDHGRTLIHFVARRANR